MCHTVLRSKTALVLVVICSIGASACSRRTTDPMPLGTSDRSNATPWMAAHGSFVAVAWGASASGGTDVLVATSRDAGRTFSAPVQVNTVPGEARLGGEMPPRVALAPLTGSDTPEIVVLWTARQALSPDTPRVTEVKSARSRDGGRTFAAPVALQAGGAPGDRGWPALTVDGTGMAHAIWLDHRGMAAAHGSGSSHTPGHGAAPADGTAMALKSSLYHASLGNRASPEAELTRSVCYCCKTALATGTDGTVYAAWRHVYPGDLRDIAFSASRPGAASFASPVRVSEDQWAVNGCPDNGPAIAVDRGGAVHIVWFTVEGGEQPRGALFYSSTSNGRTFAPRTRIPTLGSPTPTHPYIGVDEQGRIVVAWDEISNGRRVASAREIRPRASAQPTFGPVVTLNATDSAMYPVLASTDQGLLAVWTAPGDPSRVMLRHVELP